MSKIEQVLKFYEWETLLQRFIFQLYKYPIEKNCEFISELFSLINDEYTLVNCEHKPFQNKYNLHAKKHVVYPIKTPDGFRSGTSKHISITQNLIDIDVRCSIIFGIRGKSKEIKDFTLRKFLIYFNKVHKLCNFSQNLEKILFEMV